MSIAKIEHMVQENAEQLGTLTNDVKKLSEVVFALSGYKEDKARLEGKIEHIAIVQNEILIKQASQESALNSQSKMLDTYKKGAGWIVGTIIAGVSVTVMKSIGLMP